MVERNDINISRIPVNGTGALGLVALAGVVTYVLPPLRAIGIPVIMGGIALGLTLVAVRNRQVRRWSLIGAAAAAVVCVVLVARIMTGG